jgi:hypothetical protein
MKLTSTSNNHPCFIDELDSDLSQYTWSRDDEGYFKARSGPYKDKLLHRVIAARMGLDLSQEIDHKDIRPENNIRSNLRFATRSLNQLNGHCYKNNKCGCRGVRFLPKLQKWTARIQLNGVRKYLGFFDTMEEAAICYESKRKQLVS